MKNKSIYFLLFTILISLECASQVIKVIKKADCYSNEIILGINIPQTNSISYCVNYLDENKGLYYFKTCQNLLFDDAENVAQWLNGHLATANTKELNDYIARLHPSTHWIGYKQNPKSPLFNDPPDASSGFEWLSGQPNKQTFWKSGEPDNYESYHPGMTTVQNCDQNQSGLWCDAEPELKFEGIIETNNPIIPNTPISIRWSTGETTPSISITDKNLKLVELEIDNSGRKYNFTISLDSLRLLSFSEYPNTIISSQAGNLIQLQASNQNATDYQWFPDRGLSTLFGSKTSFVFDGIDINYSVKFKDTNGCLAEEKFTIQNSNRYAFTIPSAFSPNNDGINDFFFLNSSENFDSFHIYIYNQWGEIIFFSPSQDFNWDGKFNQKVVPFGLYFLEIKYTDKTTKTIRRPLYVLY